MILPCGSSNWNASFFASTVLAKTVEASEEESEGPSVEESVIESIAGDEPAAAGGNGEAAEREVEESEALELAGEAPVTVEAAEETAAVVPAVLVGVSSACC